jgi:hypothetical protein
MHKELHGRAGPGGERGGCYDHVDIEVSKEAVRCSQIRAALVLYFHKAEKMFSCNHEARMKGSFQP